MREDIKRGTDWLFTFAILIIFTLTAGELLVHIFKYKPLNEMTFYKFRQRDPILDHSFIPNSTGKLGSKEFRTTYKINSMGFRDYEYALNKPDNVERILILGDSFIEGYGVNIDDTCVKILERKLNQRGGSRYTYEVINCGILSYSPTLEYLQLKEKGLCLNPDTVILFLDQSDLQDDYIYKRFLLLDDDSRPKAVPNSNTFVGSPEEYSSLIDAFLSRHSAFYVYVKQKMRKIGRRDPPEGHGPVLANIESDRLFFLRENPKDYQVHWDRTASYLRLINDMLKERGVDFIIVVYPYAHQVDPHEWKCRIDWGFELGCVYLKGRYFESARKFCVSNSIKFIDLYDSFANYKRDKKTKLFYEIDGHWTTEGHKLVAESVLKLANL